MIIHGEEMVPLQTCQYPVHTGPRMKLKTRNAVSYTMSKEIGLLFAKDVPIDSRKFDIALRKSYLVFYLQTFSRSFRCT